MEICKYGHCRGITKQLTTNCQANFRCRIITSSEPIIKKQIISNVKILMSQKQNIQVMTTYSVEINYYLEFNLYLASFFTFY